MSINKNIEKENEQKDCPAWGLKRISQRKLTQNVTSYFYPETQGAGIDVYVIDTVFTYTLMLGGHGVSP
jgi:hypothetical protein